MKYTSRGDLLSQARTEKGRLDELVDGLSPDRCTEGGVWGDDWSVTDLLAHLSAWHRLFLGWHEAGLRGEAVEMPAEGYTWRETPRLNRDLQKRDAGKSFDEARRTFDESHERVMGLLGTLTEAQIMEAGWFAWTGRNALSTYAGANTASHYRFAGKVIRRWLRTRGLAPHEPSKHHGA